MKEKQSLEEIYKFAGRGLTKQLLEIIKEEALVPWFYKPNEAFNGKKPIDICKRGKTERLERMYLDIACGNPL